MPRNGLRSELAAKLNDGWTGPAGRHVLDIETPNPSGIPGRHALATEIDAIVVGPAVPTFHGTATSKAFTATNAVGAITGALVGDVLIAFCAGNDQTASVTPPAGEGWTVIGDTGGAVAARMWVYATTATAVNQAGGTWTWPGSHNHVVTILAYDNVTKPTAASMVRAGASATSVATPSLTSVGAGAILVTYAFFATNGTAPAWPGSMTVRSPNSGATASGVAADESLPTPGASGTRTFTAGGTPAALTAAAVLLEPTA